MKRRRTPSPSLSSSPSSSSWRLAVKTALALLVSASDATSYLHTGSGAAFYHSNISTAGCGLVSWPAIANTNYAAALGSGSGSVQGNAMRNTSACGRCARVWCDDDRCLPTKDTSSLVYIVEDQRASEPNDLNLAPAVFRTITGFSSGRVNIRWRFVDCPTTSPAPEYEDPQAPGTICVNRESTAYWLALQPVNDTLGIERVDVNGASARLMPSPSYFFTLTDPLGRLDLSRLEISVTTRSRRVFKKMVAVQPGGCVGLYLKDEQTVDDNSSSTSNSNDGSGSSSSSSPPPMTTRPSTPTITLTTTPPPSSSRPSPQTPPSSSQPGATRPTTSPQPTPPPPNSDDNDAAATPRTPIHGSNTHAPKPPAPPPLVPPVPSSFVSPPSPSTSGDSSPAKPTSPATATPARPPPDSSTAESPAPPAIIPLPADSDSKETPGSPLTATPIASKVSDTSIDPSVSFPAMRTTDIPPGNGPASLDRDARPTQAPGAHRPGSKPSSDTTTRPLETPTPPAESGSNSNTQPPKPTPAGGPGSSLSRGVLTNPLFVGLLLGTVGLIGAVVAYRAKSRQQHLLAMAPPVASTHVTPRQTSRAAYTSDPVLGAL